MRFAVPLPFAICLGAALAGPARAQQPAGERELSVVNRSAQAINEIYVSPSNADHWGEDRLGDATLPTGRTLHLRLGRGKDCEFDIQVIYEDASREEAHGANVCRQRQMAFDGSAATPAVAAAAHEVTVANRSPRPIQQVLISPSQAGEWGEDRLRTSISVGDSATVRYQGDCVADMRVVFDNRSAEERRGIDLCTSRRVAVQPGWTTAETVPTESQPGAAPVQLGVTNRSGRAALELHLFPEGGGDQGPDLLGSAGLPDGASVTIAFARPPAICRFTARVTFGDNQPDRTLGALDLCRSQDIVLPPNA